MTPERPQHILILTSSFPRDGDDAAGHFVLAEAQQLANQGHQVTVATAGKGQAQSGNPRLLFLGAEELFAQPGAWERAREDWTRLRHLLSPSLKVSQLARSTAFDRVIAHFLIPSALPWAMPFVDKRLPLEVVVHGSDLRLFLKLPVALRNTTLRRLLRHGAQLRFVSQELKTQLVKSHLSQDLWAPVARSAVRPASLEVPTMAPPAELRRQLQIAPDARLALVVGRLIDSKRVSTALRALELVPSCDVRVIGDGPLKETITGQFPDVIFLGHLPRLELLKWMAAADVVVSASRQEGAPTVVREARALGIPMVATDSGDLTEWAKTDDELFIVP